MFTFNLDVKRNDLQEWVEDSLEEFELYFIINTKSVCKPNGAIMDEDTLMELKEECGGSYEDIIYWLRDEEDDSEYTKKEKKEILNEIKFYLEEM